MVKAGYFMIRAFVRKLREDTVSAFAAQTAFFVILSFLPFLMFLLTLVRFLPFGRGEMLQAVHSFFPAPIRDFMGVVLKEALQKTSGTFLSISAGAALWSASRGILVIVRGLNRVYGNGETRNYFVLRLLSVCYTIVFTVVLVVTLVLLVFGNQIFLYVQSRVPLMAHAAMFVILIRTVVSFLLLIAFFWALYLFVPDRKPRHISVELPGAVLCATGWMGFSYLFSFYIDHMSDFSAMYGSLTAIVLCMVWLYACMYLLFAGAEFNVIVSDVGVREAWAEFVNSLKRKKKGNRAQDRGNTFNKKTGR